MFLLSECRLEWMRSCSCSVEGHSKHASPLILWFAMREAFSLVCMAPCVERGDRG